MHTITYVSTAMPELNEAQIAELLSQTVANNTANNFTGILIYSEGNFFQVLEGEKEGITRLFAKIKQDSRHYNLIKIFERETENSTFTKYGSSFTVISNSSQIRDLYRFLNREKENNPEGYNNIQYLAQKFMTLI